MLVFRRQQGESFLVGDNVEVHILEVRGGEVKIGVVAPREVAIYRSEIAHLNRQAAVRDRQAPGVKNAIAALQKSLQARRDR